MDDHRLLCETVIHLINQIRKSSGDVKNILQGCLDVLCRNVEKLSIINVSRAAQARADEMGIGDLRRFKWKDQTRKGGMNDKGRVIFHWDHFATVGDVRRSLEGMRSVSLREVEAILSTIRVAWILKEENQRLDQLGYKTRRPDPAAAYAEAGIELLYSWDQ